MNGFEDVTIIPKKPIDEELDSLLQRLLILNQKGVEHTEIIRFCADNTNITESTVQIVLQFESLREISLRHCFRISDETYHDLSDNPHLQINIDNYPVTSP